MSENEVDIVDLLNKIEIGGKLSNVFMELVSVTTYLKTQVRNDTSHISSPYC